MEYRELFDNYTKDKIKKLGNFKDSPILMHSEGVREFDNVDIITDDYGSFICVDKDGNIVIDTQMISPAQYAASMDFQYIDPRFLNELYNYWEDLDMEALIDLEMNTIDESYTYSYEPSRIFKITNGHGLSSYDDRVAVPERKIKEYILDFYTLEELREIYNAEEDDKDVTDEDIIDYFIMNFDLFDDLNDYIEECVQEEYADTSNPDDSLYSYYDDLRKAEIENNL